MIERVRASELFLGLRCANKNDLCRNPGNARQLCEQGALFFWSRITGVEDFLNVT